MLSLGALRLSREKREFAEALERSTPLILLCLLSIAAFQKYTVLVRTDGGADLVQADIPKSLMLLQGQDPYSLQPWASPYPPLLLVVVGGIIRATSGPDPASASVAFLARNIMMAGLLASLATGVLIFLGLRRQGFTGLKVILPTAIFLLLPSISTSPFFFFHSDVFGYPILAGALLALVAGRLWTGSTLLAVATIFKLHPLLALVLVFVWMGRRFGLRRTLPSLTTSVLILSAGLVAPLWVPGYSGAILGFNLSNANGTVSFSIMNLFYGVLPSMGFSFPLTGINQIWLVVSTVLFVVVLVEVWSRASSLGPVEVVLLGLLAWLLPLRQMYTHYVVWGMIPFLMRGRLVGAVVGGGILELANTMAVWSWNVPPNPLPVMNSVFGFFLTSLVYAAFSLFGLLTVFWGRGQGASRPGQGSATFFRA